MKSMLSTAALQSLLYAVATAQSCDTVQQGYQSQPSISHFWGQYSPFFSVPSEISADIPDDCHITFAQILSRHGARDPTASKTKVYNATITALKANVTSFTSKYAFLVDYDYTLGADQLTTFGQQELINSGIKFFSRYPNLTATSTPFIRSSSEARVVESAQNWTQGYHSALTSTGACSDPSYPYPVVVISEDSGSNNTLNHGLCTNFESDGQYYSSIADNAQKEFTATFIPAIRKRLEADLPGAKLSTSDVINLMDLCPFNTVADPASAISPFCVLFSSDEWHAYNYYEALDKYYGYGAGNPLGPTQGVGWTNELIARLTGKPVMDSTSTNHTLDSNAATFPLDRKLYADFSHDNNMMAIMYAMGLYNSTPVLSNKSIIEAEQAGGYSASWTVPFAARVYVEKMICGGGEWSDWKRGQQSKELVRVLVNDRVIALENCGADELGRCEVAAFVESLSFAVSGGRWAECFD